MGGSNSDVELLRHNPAPDIWAASDVSLGVKDSFLVTLYRILSAPVALNPHRAVCQWQHGTLGGPSIQPLTHLIRQSLKGAKHVHVAYTPPIFTRVLFFFCRRPKGWHSAGLHVCFSVTYPFIIHLLPLLVLFSFLSLSFTLVKF